MRVLLAPKNAEPTIPTLEQSDSRVMVVDTGSVTARKWGMVNAVEGARTTASIYPRVLMTGTVGRMRVPKGHRGHKGLGVVPVELLEFPNGKSVWVEANQAYAADQQQPGEEEDPDEPDTATSDSNTDTD